MNRSLIKRAARWLAAGIAAAALASCGGGGTCTDAFGGTACGDGGAAVTVGKLTLTLSALSIPNSGSQTITATVVATNANNQTQENAPVVLSVDSDANIVVNGSATDANGLLTGTVSIGDSKVNRTVKVTATANNGALSVSKTFQVVGAKLSGTPVPAVIAPSAAGTVKYRLVDANANPMSTVSIVVTGPGGVETTGVTGSNGDYDYNYTAPTTTGDLNIVASAGGSQLTTTVQVQAAGGGGIPPAALIVRSASVSANPSVVATNTGTTSNQSQIRVLFLSDNNAPIKNMRVRFDLAGDVNSIGGSFSTGTSLVYSDADGVATSAYIPGSRGSPTDGVTIRACYDAVDFAVCDPAKSVTTTLTVAADPVSITIGTNNLIEEGASGITYVKRYIVQVVDSSGVAKPDVQITPSIDLINYIKGRYELVVDTWIKQAPITVCPNEDLNRNNARDVFPAAGAQPAHDEDVNRSFNLTPGRPALEPRKADVAISFEGASRTDAGGKVVLRIEYAQDLGSWVDFNILVSASGVSGTEGRASYSGTLPVPGEALKDKDTPPAFVVSPYGVQDGAKAPPYEFPAGSGNFFSLCTNPN